VDRGLLLSDIMPAGTEPLVLLPPPDNIVERIHLVFNNVSLQNLDQKAVETRGVLEAEFLPWFGNYMVVKRISTQPNFHTLYMAFLLKLDAPELLVAVLSSVFHNVSMLLASQKITTSTSERSLLKNLGSWLGQMTLARNKPILQRKLDVKELLCQGFETGRLIAVTPFVAKIMEGAKDSRVFRPPNPWVMSLMGVLRELYDMEELKMNIKFEIEVLCKHLGLKIDDVSPARVLCGRLQPHKDKTPDFNVRPSALSASMAAANTAEEQSRSGTPQPAAGSASADAGVAAAGAAAAASGAGAGAAEAQQAAAAVAPVAGGGDGGSQQGEQTVIPNLGAYVTVNQMLPLFQQHPNLKSSVPIAVDRAIREIIQPAVERSVTIACITTKELVNKDFALEGNEQKMRKAAQLMVSNLAGSLAVVTCKEPLRLSMANTLRTLLVQQAAASLPANTQLDPAALEQAVQACSGDNLELGCMLIEKAATEAAIRDIDEALAVPLAERRKAAAQGQLFPKNDSVAGKRYPNALPEMLRPTRAGLGPQQLMVYEAFARQPRQPPTAGGSAPASAGAEGGGGSGGVSLMDAQQGMAMYGRLVTALEKSMEAVREQAGARASLLSLAVLGPEHEVSMLVRKALELTVKINLSEREAAAYQFARSIFFKKVVEEGDELLKLECYVGVLAGLKDECKKLTKDIVNWITYLSISDEIKVCCNRFMKYLIIQNLLVTFEVFLWHPTRLILTYPPIPFLR
jgi:CCR4-NOT transcription complex subunit 1